jgi:hypothetical protein
MRDCYNEEFADVPATAQDFLYELLSRCATCIGLRLHCGIRIRVRVSVKHMMGASLGFGFWVLVKARLMVRVKLRVSGA